MIIQLTSTSTELFALDSDGRIWHYLHGGWEEVKGPPPTSTKKPTACICETASPSVRQRMAGTTCSFCMHTIKCAA
jgi:hypothetical protein